MLGERFAPFRNLSAHYLLAGARMNGVTTRQNVRRAGPDDYDAIAEMWREFDHEVPPPIHEGPGRQEKELAEVAEILAGEVAFVAEEDGNAPSASRSRAGGRRRSRRSPTSTCGRTRAAPGWPRS